jgi:hypothetical protein
MLFARIIGASWFLKLLLLFAGAGAFSEPTTLQMFFLSFPCINTLVAVFLNARARALSRLGKERFDLDVRDGEAW